MGRVDGTDATREVAPDRMSGSDAILWNVERDPALRSTIVVAFLLDRAPEPARLAAMFERLVERVPRLRQRVVEDPLGLAPPRWVADPHFDRAYHVRQARLPAPGTMRALYDFVGPIAADPFDRSRPLWEALCVDGFADGRFAIVWKVNHALADGYGLLWILLNMVDGGDPEALVHDSGRAVPSHGAPPSWGALESLADALRFRLQGALAQGRRIASAVRNHAAGAASSPIESAGAVVDTVRSIARVLQPAFTPISPLWRARSLSSRFDAIDVPLDSLRHAARRAGGSINDAFLAAAAGGLARYHRAHRVEAKFLRVGMPTSVRRSGTERLGNQFVPLRLTLPLTIRDPLRRQHAIADLSREARAESGVAWADEVTGALTLLGAANVSRIIGGVLRGLDLQASNVVGPAFAISLAGVRLARLIAFGPLSGAPLNLTLISYDGVASIGVHTDPAAIPDTERLLACLRAGFAEVRRTALPAIEVRSQAEATTSPRPRRPRAASKRAAITIRRADEPPRIAGRGAGTSIRVDR